MARGFATSFRRRMVAAFAGDAVPAGAQVANNPTTGAGVLLRLPSRRANDPAAPVRRLQGFLVHGGGFAGTWTLSLYVADRAGTDAAVNWVQVGNPLAGVAAGVLWEAVGVTMDADVVIRCVPSLPIAGAETVDLFLEPSE